MIHTVILERSIVVRALKMLTSGLARVHRIDLTGVKQEGTSGNKLFHAAMFSTASSGGLVPSFARGQSYFAPITPRRLTPPFPETCTEPNVTHSNPSSRKVLLAPPMPLAVPSSRTMLRPSFLHPGAAPIGSFIPKSPVVETLAAPPRFSGFGRRKVAV